MLMLHGTGGHADADTFNSIHVAFLLGRDAGVGGE
jgi:hypothetical protein